MNKKASFELAGEMVVWFFRIFMLAIVVVTLAIIVNAYVKTKIDTTSLEHKIIIDKVMLQPGCVNAYMDKVDRWMVYSVDIRNFNEASLKKCIVDENIGLRLRLSYNEKNVEARYNDRQLGYLSFCGKSRSFRCSQGRLIVKVFDDNKLYDGLLDYEVVTGNE